MSSDSDWTEKNSYAEDAWIPRGDRSAFVTSNHAQPRTKEVSELTAIVRDSCVFPTYPSREP